MNKELEIQIVAIKNRIVQLVAQNNTLAKENDQLKNKIIKEETNNINLKESIENLKQQINALQMIQGNMSVEDKKELAKTIDKYISDINKTINLLNEN